MRPTLNTNTPTSIPTASPTLVPTTSPSMSPTVDRDSGVVIYAVNGWDDIDIQYNGSYGREHGGIMNCGSEYELTCDIAPKSWSCKEQLCNSEIMTTQEPANSTSSITDKPVISTISSTNNNYDENNEHPVKRTSGELMILGGVGFVLLTCVCVGWAKAAKDNGQNDNDKKQLKKGKKKRQKIVQNRREISLSQKESKSKTKERSARIRNRHDLNDPIEHTETEERRDCVPLNHHLYHDDHLYHHEI